MEWFEALILGVLQGLTEYLPVSSSGHLAIAQNLFGLTDADANLSFTVTVHVATVLSTCVILWKEIVWLFRDLFKFKWNEGTRYTVNILVSMIPVGVVGLFFKDQVETVFGGDALMTTVGICLLVTASLLAFSYWAKPRQREQISVWHAFVIGLAQAAAVMPGLSRSGSTIATGLLLGDKKERLAQFSFLMVIPPILGEGLLDVKEMAEVGVSQAMGGISPMALLVGFVAAFVSGCIACKWMISLVKRGRLIWFALYCAIVGVAVLVF
ncbi:MAG: undecaprenyl-diphosphate phosphatase [Bacteroidales bacterium]|nr:undecaprenyl-diphosphate phosphatase [Bacteroidales bacterium]